MKTALITGGSRGIGLGIARHLGATGYAIALNGVRSEDQVGEALEEVRSAGAPEVIYCQGDVSSAVDREAILGHVRERFGHLNVLVNNAGVSLAKRYDVLETTQESYDRVMGINLEGPFFLSQAAARWLIEQKGANPAFQGCLINVNSISATMVSTNRAEYCVSKAGLAMLTEIFAARLGEHDLPVFELRPGIIKSDMTSGVTGKYDKLIAEGLCITSRWGLPDDVGKVAAAIVDGDFAYSTGQVFMIDGGMTIPRL